MPVSSQRKTAMRALLVAAVLALALLGAGPAALSLPPLPPDLGPAQAPDVPASADIADEPALPESPVAAPLPFHRPDFPMPPAGAVGATAVGGAALALVGFALYSRLSRGELLDHERRDGVYQLVRAEPGISLSDIASRSGLGWGTAVYHLERLEKAGFVTSERSGGRRCYFPIGEVPKDARPHLGALQQDALRDLASLVVERPGVTQSELAEALGITPGAASKQVSKLESVGLVRREREWKTVRLHPEPALTQILAPMPSEAVA